MELKDKLADTEIDTPEEIDKVGNLIRAELENIVEKSIAFDVLDSEDKQSGCRCPSAAASQKGNEKEPIQLYNHSILLSSYG